MKCPHCNNQIQIIVKKFTDTLPLDEWVFPIGKHTGLTLDDIYNTDRQYLKWVAKEHKDESIKKRVIGYLSGVVD